MWYVLYWIAMVIFFLKAGNCLYISANEIDSGELSKAIGAFIAAAIMIVLGVALIHYLPYVKAIG